MKNRRTERTSEQKERTIEQQCERIELKEQEERTIWRKREYLKYKRL